MNVPFVKKTALRDQQDLMKSYAGASRAAKKVTNLISIRFHKTTCSQNLDSRYSTRGVRLEVCVCVRACLRVCLYARAYAFQ
jgi:hypothetical protein